MFCYYILSFNNVTPALCFLAQNCWHTQCCPSSSEQGSAHLTLPVTEDAHSRGGSAGGHEEWEHRAEGHGTASDAGGKALRTEGVGHARQRGRRPQLWSEQTETQRSCLSSGKWAGNGASPGPLRGPCPIPVAFSRLWAERAEAPGPRPS